MKQRKSLFALSLGLTLAIAPGAARAADEPKEPEVVERRVIVRPGQEPQVFEWHGKPGERGPLPGGPQGAAITGRGYLGVQLVDLTPALQAHFSAPEGRGVLVGEVEKDSPAGNAGLEVGDVLVAVGDQPVGDSWDVMRTVRPKKEGDIVALEILRDGRTERLTATIAERERETVELAPLLWHAREGELDDKALGKLDPETLGPAMRKLEIVLDSPEMKERLERVQERRAELEQRLRELEQRLQELEKKVGARNR